jgi:two-component system, cell cycle response regulator
MKILVADDDPISRRLLEVCLSEAGYEVSVAVDGAEALRMISQPDSPRLLVLDRVMPLMDGVEVCRAIRKGAPEPYVYVILLTGRSEQEEIVEGFEAGADDYITKPFEIQELKARVRTGARIVERQEQLISAREQLRVEAMYDALTALLNRAAFFDIFKKEVARADRQKAPLALIMADLDHFKDTNDRYGHLAGDAVLVETAHRLRSRLRVSDSIGRYGGEEFVIVAPGCNAADAAALAERFRLSICGKPVDVASDSIPVTMSFGVAATSDMTKSSQLLRAADEALYRAKNGGRNTVQGVELAS